MNAHASAVARLVEPAPGLVSTAPPVIRLEAVTKNFNPRGGKPVTAVDDVSLSVGAG